MTTSETQRPSNVAAEAELAALKRGGGGVGGGRAIRLTFYCNGNPFYGGRQVRVAPRSYGSLDELLVELDRLLPPAAAPPLFGVRRLYTPAGGRQVRDVGELCDGGSYVCAGSEPFRSVGYGKTKAAPWRNGHIEVLQDSSSSLLPPLAATRTERRLEPIGVARSGGADAVDCSSGTGSPGSPSLANRINRGLVLLPPLHFIARHLVASQRNALAVSTDSSVLRLAESQLRHASLNKTATVLVARPGRCRRGGNGGSSSGNSSGSRSYLGGDSSGGGIAAGGQNIVDGCSAVCMLLSRQGLQSFETLLVDLSEAFGRRWRLNRVRRLYALSGRDVLAVADLFRDDRVFVAVGRERVSRNDLARMVNALLPGEPFPDALLRTLRRRYKSPERRQRQQLHTLCDSGSNSAHGDGRRATQMTGS